MALALLAGLFVGGAMMLAEPLKHRCGADLQVASAGDSGATAESLRDFAAFLLARQPGGGIQKAGWDLLSPSPDRLRLTLDSSDPTTGVKEAELLAGAFAAHMAEMSASRWSTPTESESFLQSYVAKLKARLNEAQAQLDQAMASLPSADPRPERTGLMDRWQSTRADFETARDHLLAAAEEYSRISSQGDPQHATVPPAIRQAAVLADADLQQDLKELKATLSELKLHMLNVWQNSAASLHQLASFGQASALPTASGEQVQTQAPFAAIAEELAGYQAVAAGFSKNWNAEFSMLQQSSLDAESSNILDVYQRARSLLGDFLFHAGNRLASIREKVAALSKDPADDARHHLRQSDAARALAEIQSAHHRFEFAAGALDTPNNFRLDSSLRIARGLRRRTTDRIRAIDQRLQQEAIALAKEQQGQALMALEAILQKGREASDETVAQLIALQDRLHHASDSTQQFVSAVAAAEAANQRLQLARADLDQAAMQLQGLTQKRTQARTDAQLKVTWAGIVQKNVNLSQRLRAAGTGAAVAFLAVLLGQIVLARSLWPAQSARSK